MTDVISRNDGGSGRIHPRVPRGFWPRSIPSFPHAGAVDLPEHLAAPHLHAAALRLAPAFDIASELGFTPRGVGRGTEKRGAAPEREQGKQKRPKHVVQWC
jgi:hypothetical protein